jgi:hypothetical protein
MKENCIFNERKTFFPGCIVRMKHFYCFGFLFTTEILTKRLIFN